MFRSRLRVWQILALLLVVLLAATAVAAQTDSAPRAAEWLAGAHQNEDGGYASFSTGASQAPSDPGGTADALLALAAAGADTSAPLAYLRDRPEDLVAYAAADPGQAGKLLLALVAAGATPRDFGGTDYVALLQEQLGTEGQFGGATAFTQSLAILGLVAAGADVPETAVSWLQSQQASGGDLDGSWDDGFSTPGNTDATGMAIMALVAGGVTPDDPALTRAADFLESTRLPSGGWEYGSGFGENANSTALAAQAQMALGADASQARAALLTWQSESGAFQADFGDGRFDDFFTTAQAIPAAAQQPYPLAQSSVDGGSAMPSSTTFVIAVLGGLVVVMLLGIILGRRDA